MLSNFWKPLLLGLVFGTASSDEGGFGANLFSKGFRDATELDFDLFLSLGVHTTPLMITPLTSSPLGTVSFSVEDCPDSRPPG